MAENDYIYDAPSPVAPAAVPPAVDCGASQSLPSATSDCCNDNANLVDAISHLAEIIAKIEAHLAESMAEPLGAIAHCQDKCAGQCNCCCDDCNRVAGRCANKIVSHCQAVLTECLGYAFQVPAFQEVTARQQAAQYEATTGIPLPVSPATQPQTGLVPVVVPPQSPAGVSGGGAGFGAGAGLGVGAGVGVGEALAAAQSAAIAAANAVSGGGSGIGSGSGFGVGAAVAAALAGAQAGSYAYAVNGGNNLVVNIQVNQLLQILVQALVQAALEVLVDIGYMEPQEKIDPISGKQVPEVKKVCQKDESKSTQYVEDEPGAQDKYVDSPYFDESCNRPQNGKAGTAFGGEQ